MPYSHQHSSLPNPELTTGVRFLGQPIGSKDFATSFLADAAAKFTSNLQKLQDSGLSHHAQLLLLHSCALPSLQHLHASDIYYHCNPTTATNDTLDTWSSPFITAVTQATHSFLAFLTNLSSLPAHASAIAHHPARMGGLGSRHHQRAAKTAFMVSTARSLSYATNGVPITQTHSQPLPSGLSRSLASWQNPHSTVPLVHLFNALCPTFLETLHQAKPSLLAASSSNALVGLSNFGGIASSVYNHLSSIAMDAFKLTAPPAVAMALPSLLNHLTTLPLISYNLRFPHNRLSDDHFTILLQRKLRVPVLPPTLLHRPCPYCQHTLDPLGDHLFKCRYSKKGLSDDIRNVLYFITSSLAPLAKFVSSKHSVTCETGGLVSHFGFPNQRPADVGLHLQPSALRVAPPFPASFLAIDVTVTNCPDASETQPTNQNKLIQRAHLSSIRSKLHTKVHVNKEQYFASLLQAGIILLPFTVDPFGSLGHFAHAFLYGSTNRPPPPPPPNWVSTLSTHATTAYNQLCAAPRGLLPSATLHYCPKPSPALTQPPMSPGRWAHQTLALNLSASIALHVQRSLSNAFRSLYNSGSQPQSVLAQPLRMSHMPTCLDPFPYFLRVGASSD